MIRNIARFMTVALPIVAFALTSSAAMAQSAMVQSYSGNWPVRAALPLGFGDTGCLTLADNGIVGGVHSGSASLSGDLGTATFGSFVIVNNILLATIDPPTYTTIYYLVFTGSATKGILGNGFFEDLAVGYPYPSGALTFGKKGGC